MVTKTWLSSMNPDISSVAYPNYVPDLRHRSPPALSEMVMDALSNIRTLLLYIDKNGAVVSVETNIGRDKADVTVSSVDDGLVVSEGLGGDLAKDHDHVGLGVGVTDDLAFKVLGENITKC